MVAGSQLTVRGVRGCTEMNFYLRKIERKKKKRSKPPAPLPPASGTILGLGRPDGKGGHKIGSKSASRRNWDVRTGWQGSELGLRRGNAELFLPEPVSLDTLRGMCPWPAGGRKTSRQPQAHSAIGDTRSLGEGGCEARSQVREAKPPARSPGQPEGFEP